MVQGPPVYRGGPTVVEVWGIGYQWRSYFVHRGTAHTPRVSFEKRRDRPALGHFGGASVINCW